MGRFAEASAACVLLNHVAASLATRCVGRSVGCVACFADRGNGRGNRDVAVSSRVVWLLRCVVYQSRVLALSCVRQIVLRNDHVLLCPVWQYLPKLPQISAMSDSQVSLLAGVLERLLLCFR